MLVRIVKMVFKSEAIVQFQELFEARKGLIRNFEGCCHLELWQDKDAPNVFFTYSHWESENALNTYRRSDFFEETWQQTRLLFADKPQAWSVHQKVIIP